MSHHYQVVPECYADTLLIETLGFKRPNHGLNSNIISVIRTVTTHYPNQRVVGVIDDDKKKGKQLDIFQRKAKKENIQKLVLDKQTILIICPALESWIFENADSVGVNPSTYGFHTARQFRKLCKRIDANKNQNLKNFLNTLKQKKAPGLIQLKKWICEGARIDINSLR